MVTEYNKYLLNKRRMEEAEKSASPAVKGEQDAKDGAVAKENLTAETEETPAEVKPKKTDAEKLKKGKK